MLKIGAQDITGLYVGETKIEKAYLGEELVYSAGVTKEYQDYEYFSVDASAVVDNYTPYAQIIIYPRLSVNGKNTAYTFYFKASIPTNTLSSGSMYSYFVDSPPEPIASKKYVQYILTAYVTTSQKLNMSYSANSGTSSMLGSGYSGSISGTGFLNIPITYKFIFNSAGLQYDMYAGDTLVRAGYTSGSSYPFSNLTSSNSFTLNIMGNGSKATSSTSSNIYRGKLHAFAIFSPAVTFNDSMWYIPCKKTSTGELGFRSGDSTQFLKIHNSQYIITGPKVN